MKQPYKQRPPVMVDLQDNVYNAGGRIPVRGQVVNGQGNITEYKAPTTKPAIKQQIKQEQQARPQGMGGSTNDPYVAQANALYQQLMSRGPFRYDMQGDMLYRQYADQYQQLGRQAMQDTMGYASGQTGGYNSSWGQTLGQQAYQGYLGQLNSMIPDFYDRAYQAYLNEGDRLMEQYQLALQHPGYIADMQGSSGGTGSTSIDPTKQDEEKALSEEAIKAYIDALSGGKISDRIRVASSDGTTLTGEELAKQLAAKGLAEKVAGKKQAENDGDTKLDFKYFDDWYKYIVNQQLKNQMK